MKRTMTAFLLMAWLAGVTAAHADYEHPSRLLSESELVFEGTVVGIEYRDYPVASTYGLKVPFSFVTFRMDRILKGTFPTNRFTLRILGGQSPETGRILIAAGLPRFEVGSTELVFVRGNGWAACPLVGCSAGRIRMDGEAARDNAGHPLSLNSARELIPIPEADEAVTLSSFGKRVIEERNSSERMDLATTDPVPAYIPLKPEEALAYFEELRHVANAAYSAKSPGGSRGNATALSIGLSSAVEPISIMDAKPKIAKPGKRPGPGAEQSRLEELEASELAKNNGNPVIRR